MRGVARAYVYGKRTDTDLNSNSSTGITVQFTGFRQPSRQLPRLSQNDESQSPRKSDRREPISLVHSIYPLPQSRSSSPVPRNQARIPKYDYWPLKIDSSVSLGDTTVMAAHCRKCFRTFTAVSSKHSGARSVIRRKYRNHVKDGVCHEEKDGNQKPLQVEGPIDILETKEREGRRPLR